MSLRKTEWHWLAGGAVAAVLALAAAHTRFPWPTALTERAVIDRDSATREAALAPLVPLGGHDILDIPYSPSSPRNRLDVFHPPDTCSTRDLLPTVVWVHGGGPFAGNKRHIADYLRILAAKGYTAVGVGYDQTQGATFPEPLRQLNDALRYLLAHAGELRVHGGRIVLAGDSAGAEIAAQMALLVTDRRYAARVGIKAALADVALQGVILHSGLFLHPQRVEAGDPPVGVVHATGWSEFEQSDSQSHPKPSEMSFVQNIGPTFPPIFVSAGNADPMQPHSHALVSKAQLLGVDVESLFYPAGHQPPLGHQYQFDLHGAEGQEAFERTASFLARVMQ